MAMREIKFRAWYSQGDEWLYAGKRNGESSFPFTVSSPDRLMLSDSSQNNVWELPDESELIWCQYTGLKDKNGVEIFEGDIVEHSIHLIEKPILKQILFYEGSFIAKPKHDGSQSYMSMIHFNPLQTMRVIGNIYKNPELLEK